VMGASVVLESKLNSSNRDNSQVNWDTESCDLAED
jgi:hypothetical protein